MKFFKFTIVLFLAALLAVSCIKRPEYRNKKVYDDIGTQYSEYKDAPRWVIDQSEEKGIAALGIANIGIAGMQFARNEAMANGRAELARMISLKVKDLSSNFAQQTGIGDSTVVDKVSSQVTKQVTEQTLNGSKSQKAWISPAGNLHILVVLDSQIVKDHVKDAVTTSYKNDQALWQQFQAKKAKEELDKEIEKEFGK